ncbi:DUF3347 domain-containing protein [Sphingobacterium sp. BIGb0165]|uniref:DUF3347 domain-containing protein n=1 Tax=Sphingobacterium sp. BIGb0165 TaxID=2940615 RepID=UPI00216A6C5B|nr:DUF3347 domain-containing protein [Sphingobacterium sp. BIGb0165]MCS4228654.1 hypothetical protein [Sphingobacterium sp. BIGb0165]
MKRIILIVVAAMTLAACNNSKPNHTHAAHTAKEDEETSAATDKTKADAVVDTTAKAVVTETAAKTKTDAAVAKDRSLDEVYSAYFELKDALARDNGQTAQQAAKKMQAAVAKIDVAKLETATAAAWKQYQRKLAFDTEHIAGIDENGHQREHFVTLSKNMYALLKVVKPEAPVYYQHCPMYNEGKGAHWLSKQKAIDNPYLGKSMPTCGSTVETIQ